VADARPRDPFKMVATKEDAERYKFYGPESKLPDHASTIVVEQNLPEEEEKE
jgi:hypothetical protein